METCSTTQFDKQSYGICDGILREKMSNLHFRPVDTDDIGLLEHYFQKYPSRSCDYSVGGVLMWADYYEYEIAEYRDSLFIKGIWPDTDETVFYPPCGPIAAEVFRSLIGTYCRQHDSEVMILSAEEQPRSESGDGRPLGPELLESSLEYLYDIDKFIGFSGRKMEKKRNHMNFFVNNYPFTTEMISGANASELISFTLALNSAHSDDELAAFESGQVINVLRDYQAYPFFGITIRHNGKIVGYSFGECIGDTFIIHAEKGNIEYRGVYQTVASQLARAVSEFYPEVKYLNREDDMGYEYLRQSKLSYHPSLFIAKRAERIGKFVTYAYAKPQIQRDKSRV